MNELKFHFPYFWLFYRNSSLLSTRMDQPPEIHGHARYCLVNGHPAVRHGLWWYPLRGEWANRQRHSQFPNVEYGASDCLATVPGSDPQPPWVLSSRPTELGANLVSSVVLPWCGSDESWRLLLLRLSFRHGVILTIRDFIQRRIHTCSVASSGLLHLGWLFALLADTIRLDGFLITQQHDGRGWPARLRVRHGGRHLSRGAMGSLTRKRVSSTNTLILMMTLALTNLHIHHRSQRC